MVYQRYNGGVPNAPCGVERVDACVRALCLCYVPNAPCGVESTSIFHSEKLPAQFLMHRVELKVLSLRA